MLIHDVQHCRIRGRVEPQYFDENGARKTGHLRMFVGREQILMALPFRCGKLGNQSHSKALIDDFALWTRVDFHHTRIASRSSKYMGPTIFLTLLRHRHN